ncbi:fimbria/pilus outer membrane usher protein [Vibrio sp. WXL210]|uniref:fimbria/pilus outer membrane usher protein n=1 Tax=Vibrio sp. WXL210 TaxID=3450709 RepID=UPI003EC64364
MLLILFILALLFSYQVSCEEFNSHFINSNMSIDLEAFRNPNFIEDGSYHFDIYFNQAFLTDDKLQIKNSEVCFTQDLLDAIPINRDTYAMYHNTIISGDDCYNITDIPFVKLEASLNKGRVDIFVPQQHLARSYRQGFVDPELWDDGIPGIFSDYYLNYYASRSDYNTTWDQHFVTHGLIGANLGPVRLRSNYQYIGEQNSVDLTSYYAYMPLRTLGSRLSVGNLQLSSNIYPSFRMNGLKLHSDDAMLPAYLRGYSPVISGSVESDAIITLSQDGRILQVINVNAGPYVIDDLPHTSVGRIDVEVKTADGQIESFSVTDASVQYLTRPKHWRYNLAFGQTDADYAQEQYGFASAEAAYGINNHVSLFTASLLADNYQIGSLGSGFNLYEYGALSLDINHSRSVTDREGEVTGQSYGVVYNQHLNHFGLGVRVAGYRYSSRGYRDFTDHIKQSHIDYNPVVDRLNSNRKGLQTLTLTQRIKDVGIFLSYNKETYWSSERASQRLDLSLTKPVQLKGLQLYLNANVYSATNKLYDYNYQDGLRLRRTDSQGFSIGLSIPLGNSDTVNFDYRQNDGRYVQSIAYMGHDSVEYSNYRLGFDTIEGQGVGVSAAYHQEHPYWNFSLSGGHQTQRSSYVSASASGSAVLTQYGPSYSNQTFGDTKLLVDTLIPNVTINGTSREKSNRFGLALINGVIPYQSTNASIDYKHLPADIEVLDTINRLVLTEGAIGYTKIRARLGENFVARLNGEHQIPFGTSVVDLESLDEVGIVGNHHLVYLTGVHRESQLHAIWGDSHSCQIEISSSVLTDHTPIRDVLCH